jgi:hypothetical protein
MSRNLRLLALAASVIVPAAWSGTALAAGYLDQPDAPLVAPNLYNTGDAQATIARQQASGYFATPDAPLVAPTRYDTGSGAASLARQRVSGYFADPAAPLVSRTATPE